MDHSKIHGASYLVIGFLVSFISWLFAFKKLFIFFLVGIAMALYGAIRVSYDMYEYYHHRKAHKAGLAEAHPHHVHHRAQAGGNWKHCHKCGAPSHHGAKFCHQCGHHNFHGQV